MGMSTHIVRFRPADDKWNKMKTIWEECESAGVEIPKAVKEFFDYEPPRDKPGSEVYISDAIKRYDSEYQEGFEVDATKLPKDVNIVRFYNSY